MNRLSYNNNFTGIIETGDEFVGAFEESSNHTSLIVNMSISEGTNYSLSLFIQQSNSNLTPKNYEENISVGQPILLRTKYFRIILKNEEETNIKIDLHTNLFSQNLTSGSGGGNEVDTSLLASEATLETIKNKTNELQTQNVGYYSDIFNQTGNVVDYKCLLTLDLLKWHKEVFDREYRDLVILRHTSRMFSASRFLNVINNTHQYVLFNPANSTKDLYCIETSLSIKKAANNYTLICSLQKIRGFSGGSEQTPVNMNFSDTINSSVAQVYRNVAGVSGSEEFYLFQLDDTGVSNFVMEWSGYIKLSPGYGISMFISHLDNGEYICPVFRWFET